MGYDSPYFNWRANIRYDFNTINSGYEKKKIIVKRGFK
jgi:hypothetical protein